MKLRELQGTLVAWAILGFQEGAPPVKSHDYLFAKLAETILALSTGSLSIPTLTSPLVYFCLCSMALDRPWAKLGTLLRGS